MATTATHTYALLEVSPVAYDEVESKLKDAGYDHALHEGRIDMQGLALKRLGDDEVTKSTVTFDIRAKDDETAKRIAEDAATFVIAYCEGARRLGTRPDAQALTDEAWISCKRWLRQKGVDVR